MRNILPYVKTGCLVTGTSAITGFTYSLVTNPLTWAKAGASLAGGSTAPASFPLVAAAVGFQALYSAGAIGLVSSVPYVAAKACYKVAGAANDWWYSNDHNTASAHGVNVVMPDDVMQNVDEAVLSMMGDYACETIEC